MGIAGAGLLLTDNTVLTCAHVVEASLRLRRSETGDPPPGTVLVDFPAALEGTEPIPARVADGGWLRHPPAGDLAVLELEAPPPSSVRPAPVGRCGTESGVLVSVFGHPAAVPNGLWARGWVVGQGGPLPGWRQIDGLDAVGAAVERGFSGAGVWDLGRGLVVGVLASVLTPRRTDSAAAAPRVAWMIPLDALDLGHLPATPAAGPITDRAAPPSSLWPLVDRLLAMESFRVDAGTQLLAQLPAEIAAGTTRSTNPRLQLYHVVSRCGEFTVGPTALTRAVRWMEGDTLAVTDFVAQARKAWPGRLDDDD
ncbi:trypsin-like peptidase domain-containing protein [Streptomyces canus]|uniref:effector-associated domain 2-containing protein n=1 Tax=Streptomyces canus TaxID=58343 RepID=UPI00381F2D34